MGISEDEIALKISRNKIIISKSLIQVSTWSSELRRRRTKKNSLSLDSFSSAKKYFYVNKRARFVLFLLRHASNTHKYLIGFAFATYDGAGDRRSLESSLQAERSLHEGPYNVQLPFSSSTLGVVNF